VTTQDRTEHTSLASRVRAGVELLDIMRPKWWTRVNPNSLNMWSPSLCVLGQMAGDYECGADALFGEDEELGNPRAYGLEGFSEGHEDYRTETRHLTRLWAYVIRQRQAVAR
jgi:hypothetical protein